jgi:Putative zinc-finger
VRHIPEEELHAYLDQALSRSQCVEIERHLSRCPRCQDQRDQIAALRDRTTELLARIGPPPIILPAFETLKARRAQRIERRWRWISNAAWAASLAGAMLLGWQFNRRVRPSTTSPAIQAPTQASATSTKSLTPSNLTTGVVPIRRTTRSRAAQPMEPPRRSVRVGSGQQSSSGPVRFAMAVETDPDTFFGRPSPDPNSAGSSTMDVPDLIAQPVGVDPGLQGLWRTILPDSGSATPGGDVALVPGLPVIQMRVEPNNGSSDVTAVDQVLESGELIRTIAGPTGRVGSMVAENPASDRPERGDRSDGRMTITIRQGDRMVAVTGPSQALGSLLARVNVNKRRY